jgi:3-deoxy-manno-octulosonate cytidylyltransferase (CMP-KDO synthetase)
MLAPILEKPLILWTVEAAAESKLADRVIVATDSDEISRVVLEAGFEAEMTSPKHPSGTDRVWEVASRLDSRWIINLQGDEPLMRAEVLDSLAEAALKSDTDGNPLEMATLIRDLDAHEAREPNRVKIVTDLGGNALYFSRSPLPYPRAVSQTEQSPAKFLLHVGVYLYRRDILERFVSWPRTPLEMTEGLEQLRALENGIKIKCLRTSHEFLSVDSQVDIPRVETVLRARFVDKKEDPPGTCDAPD